MKKLFLASAVFYSLEKIIALLSDKPKDLKVAFIPTAADPYGKDPSWLTADRASLVQAGFDVFDVDLKNKTKEELFSDLKNAHIIFVGGGNTFYLLEKTKKSGFDEVVKKLVEQGVIYIGSSAGAALVAPDIEPLKFCDDPDKAELDSTKAIGLVDFVPFPHYEEDPLADQKTFDEFDKRYTLIPITNDEVIVVEGDTYKII